MDVGELDRAIVSAEAEFTAPSDRRAIAAERLAALREQRAAYNDGGRAEFAGWTSTRKVELFASLFRGRDDVFAVRWENTAKGRAGYAPRCANEWRRGLCEKPRVRCGACPNQAFVPNLEGEVLGHLQGRQVMGIYPLLADDSCWLLAADLDGGGWRDDVAAIRAVCEGLGLEPAVERSRSGAGAHVWFFFDEPVPALRARALGDLLLTRAMQHSASLRMDSYDRLFPSQNTLPAGGFGNLIALPLQRAARERGNTVFLDADFEPYADQWSYLASVPRIRSVRLGEITPAADLADTGHLVAGDDQDRVTPWRPSPSLAEQLASTPMPSVVRATLAQRLYVERQHLPAALIDALRRLAAFANPVFAERQGMRLSTGLTPRMIVCCDELPQHLALPRGCAGQVNELLAELGIELVVSDERSDGDHLDASFTGTLRPEQEQALEAVTAEDFGVLCAPPGAGKTVVGVAAIAARGRSTLVLVHRRPLVEQWVDTIERWLDIDPSSVGVIGSRRRPPAGVVDVATVQSLTRDGDIGSMLARYGHVVVDECHHVAAVSIERLLGSCPARFVTGLTATPYRRDGHQPIIVMQCGPIRHTLHMDADAALGLRVIRRDTAFDPTLLPNEPGIQEVYAALAADEARLELIASDTRDMLDEGRAPILLTERRDHLDRLAERLRASVPGLVTLHGDVTPRRRRQALARLADLEPNEPRLVLATGRFVGEGFDDPRLDTLVLAMPIAWKGTVVQYSGRLHRPHPDKTDVRIYDYVDAEVPVLRRMFAKRVRAYKAMGYVVEADRDTLSIGGS